MTIKLKICVNANNYFPIFWGYYFIINCKYLSSSMNHSVIQLLIFKENFGHSTRWKAS